MILRWRWEQAPPYGFDFEFCVCYGRANPSPTSGVDFEFCVYCGRANPSPTSGVDLNFAFKKSLWKAHSDFLLFCCVVIKIALDIYDWCTLIA